jgi:hypothetical protein
MKKSAICLIGVVLFLVACSHKQVSTPAERLAWHTAKLTGAYDTVGSHNPKWDEMAHQALAEFAQARAASKLEETTATEIGDQVQGAVKDGCDDPLIRYLYCRFASDVTSKPLSFRKDAYRKAAQELEDSGYSALLKFYANDRAANVWWEDGDRSLWNEVSHFRHAAMEDLQIALQDKSMPIEDVDEACGMFLDTISQNNQEMTDAYNLLQGPLSKNWPNTSVIYFFKAKYNYSLAWQARGGGYANTVTPEGWKNFKEKLEEAEAAYRKAWSLNPKEVRIPTDMIEMAVCQEKNRSEMELWFQRGMQLSPGNYAACKEKLRYLKPEWYGSANDMLEFGRECVSSNWNGKVPLILVDAHLVIAGKLEESNRAAYWRQPEVWPDVQSAYERFFQVNPGNKDGTRYYYARFAFQCGQWQEFNAQLKRIRDDDGTVDANFFGGDDALGKMVEEANSGGVKIKMPVE